MLSNIIIVRCAFFALLTLLATVIHAQIHRLRRHEDFGAWQTGFLVSLFVIFIDYTILSKFFFERLAYWLIFLDICICGTTAFIIKRQAINQIVARTQTQLVIQSYLNNKITFLCVMYLGAGIARISSCTSDDFMKEMDEIFKLYEIYEISVFQYVNEIIIQKYNQIYSSTTLLSLSVCCLLAYCATRWYIQEFSRMNMKYRYIYSVATAILVSNYNLLLFSKNPPIDFIILYPVAYLLSLVLWWWFVASEHNPAQDLYNRNPINT